MIEDGFSPLCDASARERSVTPRGRNSCLSRGPRALLLRLGDRSRLMVFRGLS